jgi:hypothetical protein
VDGSKRRESHSHGQRARNEAHLVSGEVNKRRRLPLRDQVPAGAEPDDVARDLRRGVQPRQDRYAQAVAASRTYTGGELARQAAEELLARCAESDHS